MSKRFLLLLTYLTCISVTFLSCSKDDDGGDPISPIARRTIMVYITGENNLNKYITANIESMTKGSATLSADCNLIVFVDNVDSKKPPYILQIKNGSKTTVKEYDSDFISTDPERMVDIMEWMTVHYPADEYATILWGHGTGALDAIDTVNTSGIRLNAYGLDNGNNTSGATGTWINDNTLSKVFKKLPHMEFIMWDACHAQSAETAYELRNAADYFIGSPAEIPGAGAPYKNVVPLLGLPMSELPAKMVNTVVSNTTVTNANGICYSAICTKYLDDLAHATRTALLEIDNNTGHRPIELPVSSVIYYFRGDGSADCPLMHDMKNVMLLQVKKGKLSQQTYDNVFLPALNKVVVCRSHPMDISETGLNTWQSELLNSNNFKNFVVSDSTYSGISMIVPNKNYDRASSRYVSPNKSLFNHQWATAAGWDVLWNE